MNKKYIVLLSSFIASTSMGMQYKDLTESSDLMRYSVMSEDHFGDVYAVEQEIKKIVATLSDTNQLTQEAVLAKIKNALKPYESKPDVLPILQRLYTWHDKVVSAEVKLDRTDVHKYDATPTGSRVVLLFVEPLNFAKSVPGKNVDGYQDIMVYEEISRARWKYIKASAGKNIKNVYLVNGGKTLAQVDTQGNVSFEDINFPFEGIAQANNHSARASLMEEVNKKHAANYLPHYGNSVQESWVMKPKTVAAALDLDVKDKSISITKSGFKVEYRPTLEEIAKYLVDKAQQTGSQN